MYSNDEKYLELWERKQGSIEHWNKHYPPGTPVVVRRNREGFKTVTQGKAWMLGGHTPVIKIKGVVGWYMLQFVCVESTASQNKTILTKARTVLKRTGVNK